MAGPQLRRAGHPPGPQPALLPRREGETGKTQPLYPRGVPGRGHPPRHRVHRSAQRPVRRLGRPLANRRAHAETGQAPNERFEAGGPPRQADPAQLREAFRWSVTRKVTRTATVPLEGNAYAVDPALTGRRIELRYDPEDLSRLDVYLDGKPAGAAVPFVTRRHVHRAVPQAAHEPAPATGIDYLGMVAAAHDEAAGTGAKIDFAQLAMFTPGSGQDTEQR